MEPNPISWRDGRTPAMTIDLYAAAGRCLASRDVDEKLALAADLHAGWQAGRLQRRPDACAPTQCVAGRPPRPPLVGPARLARRGIGTVAGRAALIHAVAHIEFNAVNLACDALCRFRDMPSDYYGDWARIAAEEAHHFHLLQARLGELGHRYGDFPAHDGLWALAEQTAHDPLARMALVPRVMEARGLDVTPAMMQRFARAGDEETSRVLGIILRDEVGHVAVGNRWFRYLCRRRGLDPEPAFFGLLRQYANVGVRGPLNEAARRAAGFSETELERLRALSGAARAVD
jgi:uncharacterized ferritin-like protein (DUF455 family)